jgi:hypothetical protein
VSSSGSKKNQETCRDLHVRHGSQPVETENQGTLRGYFNYPRATFFFSLFIQKYHNKYKRFQWIFITDIFNNKVMEEKILNSKNNFINEKEL